MFPGPPKDSMAERYRHRRRPLQAGARPPRVENVRGRGPGRMRGSEGGRERPALASGGEGRRGEARPGGCARALLGTWGPFVPGVRAPGPSPHLGLRPAAASATQRDSSESHPPRRVPLGLVALGTGAAGMASTYIMLCLHLVGSG